MAEISRITQIKYRKSMRVMPVIDVRQLNLHKNEKQRGDSTETAFSFH